MLRAIDFETRKALIQARPSTGALEREHLIHPEFQRFADGSITIYDIPFEHINRNAKVVFVGITPGWTQLQEAWETFREGSTKGLTEAEILVVDQFELATLAARVAFGSTA
jgi:hypothetical protein